MEVLVSRICWSWPFSLNLSFESAVVWNLEIQFQIFMSVVSYQFFFFFEIFLAKSLETDVILYSRVLAALRGRVS